MTEKWTPAERETVITANDEDDTVHIWSSQKRHIKAMLADDAFTFLTGNLEGENQFGVFTLPASRWSPKGYQRSRKMSDVSRARAAARMAEVREARLN